MIKIKAKVLQNIAQEILQKAGSDETEAELVAEHLVQSNLSGHDSHGVGMLPTYIQNISSGFLKPGMSAKCLKEEGALLLFDGQRGYGQRTAKEAMEAAIKKCRETGLVLMALRNAHHIGRIGAFGEQAIGAGFVSIFFVNVVGFGRVAPFGGRDGRLGTNPLCIAMPGTENTASILLDMATSKIPMGKARIAMNSGRKVKEGMILDSEGNPTNDPGDLFSVPKGSLVPIGLHKGYGIALFCELLAGVLCGGGTIQPRFGGLGGIVNNMLAFLIDPKRLVDTEWMRREVDAIVAHMKASPPQDINNPVIIAGEPERKSSVERSEKGIPMQLESWNRILEVGESVGVEKEKLESFLSKENS